MVRLLLVEDDPVDQMALKRLLKKERLAFHLTMVDSLNRAKALLAVEQFDVVVADFRLGDGTALELFGFVNDVPVIVVTGGGDEAVAIQAMKAGAYDYLIKDHARAYLSFLPVVVQQAIRHREAELRVQRNHDMQNTINAVLRVSLQNTPLKAQLEEILGHVLSIPWLSQCSRGCIFLSDGPVESELMASTCLDLDQSVLQQQIHTFQEQILANQGVMVDVVFDAQEAMPGIYRTPIVSGDKALGLWLLQVPAGERYSAEVAAFITAIADTLAGIIERKRMEEALYQAKNRAESANRAKSEFLANISHELRTPMNAIIGMTDLAKECDNSEERQMFLGIVQESSRNLLTLLNGIIDFANIEANRLDLTCVPFDLRQVFSDVVDLVGHKVRTKNIQLTWSIQPDLPVCLRGDPLRLRQVVQQLVDNAIKFTDQGRITISASLFDPNDLSCRKGPVAEVDIGRKEPPICCTIAVVDTGIGIDPSWYDAVFDAFVQVDGSSTRKIGGTGLGLAVSKRLVELMGGCIGVTSSPGQGSRFYFTLSFERDLEAVEPIADALTPLTSPEIIRQPEKSLADHFAALEQALEQGDLEQAGRASGKVREVAIDRAVRSHAFRLLLAIRKGDLANAVVRLDALRPVIAPFILKTDIKKT